MMSRTLAAKAASFGVSVSVQCWRVPALAMR